MDLGLAGKVAVVTGGPDVGGAFARLPFDHLLFTGATSIAYHVMRAAAENLVPTTLELGGKSPVIIGEGADLKLTANRVMMGKTLNAGQICLAPDYVLVPKNKAADFVARGIDAGPALGHVLTLAEDAWLAADFPSDEPALKAIADQTVTRFKRDHRL